jgi:hypothetical protein
MEVLNTTTLDADPEVDRLRTEVHPRHRIAVVPATRNEWLGRKSKLWSLVQSVSYSWELTNASNGKRTKKEKWQAQ